VPREMCMALRSAVVLLALVRGEAAWLPHAQGGGSVAARGATRAAVVRAQSVSADDLIAELRNAPPAQLPKILASNINNIDQRLFLKFAELADAAADDAEREEIAQLSTTVATTIERLLAEAGNKLDVDAENVQEIMKLAANPLGEFDVPLPPERVAAVREQMKAKLGSLDDGFIGTLEAYMKKADSDGLQGLVEVLRELLQIYATERMMGMLEGSTAEEVVGVLRATLATPPSEWDKTLREQLLSDDAAASPDMVLTALQDKMGEVVLGMPSGSRVQGVLAEMLNELISRMRTIEAEMA